MIQIMNQSGQGPQRAVMALPLFFAVGFLGSAETGL